MEPKIFRIYTAMAAVWRRSAYAYADLEDEIEICIMSFCSTVVKSGYPLASADAPWLAEGHEACYALDVPQALRLQQHWHYDAGCY